MFLAARAAAKHVCELSHQLNNFVLKLVTRAAGWCISDPKGPIVLRPIVMGPGSYPGRYLWYVGPHNRQAGRDQNIKYNIKLLRVKHSHHVTVGSEKSSVVGSALDQPTGALIVSLYPSVVLELHLIRSVGHRKSQ
jgi:hypothetical protein